VGLSLDVWGWLLVGSLVGQCWLYLDLVRYHTTIAFLIMTLGQSSSYCGLPENARSKSVWRRWRSSNAFTASLLPTLLYPADIIKMSPEIPKKMKALRVNSGNQQVSPSDNADVVGNTIHSRKSMSPLRKVMKLSSRFTLLECVIRIY